MTIAAILKQKGHGVVRVPPTATASAIAARLGEERIGAVLVMDNADQLLGIVSERDIVRAVPKHGPATLEMTAGQLMTQVLHTTTPQTRCLAALEQMTQRRVRHLPVLEGDRLVGVVSIGDVVKMRLEQLAHEADSLKAYVAGG